MKHEAEVYEISAYRERLGHHLLNGADSPEEPPEPGAGQPVAAVEGGVIEKDPEGSNSLMPQGKRSIWNATPDYTRQLAFHQQELAEAEARGFPEGQTAYHAGKVAVLEALVDNVVYLEDYHGK